jgi:multidrug efflux pump subunit AcrA (membrane-fusion protein)
LRVANPNDLLRGGMLVAVTVRKEFHPSAIVVPRAAVFETESGANVFIVTSLAPPSGAAGAPPSAAAKGPPVRLMQAKVVPVQVGLQTDTQAEVRSPEIKPGTTVITTRPDALRDSSTVAIGGPAAAPHGVQ